MIWIAPGWAARSVLWLVGGVAASLAVMYVVLTGCDDRGNDTAPGISPTTTVRPTCIAFCDGDGGIR